MLIHWNLISGDSFSLVELQSESTKKNDSGHPTGECNVIKSDLKMPVDNLTSNNQLLGATKFEITKENSTVENAPIVEKGSEMKNVDDPCGVGQRLKNPEGFQQKKPAQNAEAEAAVKDLLIQFEVSLKSTQMLYGKCWFYFLFYISFDFPWSGTIFNLFVLDIYLFIY